MGRKNDKKKSKVLPGDKLQLHMVRDDVRIRDYIKSELMHHLNTMDHSVENTERLKDIPDLIVNNILNIDRPGVDLNKATRGNFKLNHIPVILLTAVSNKEYEIKTYECDVEDDGTQPFVLDVFVLRLKNIIKGKKELPVKHLQRLDLYNTMVLKNADDRKFIEKIFSIVDNNIENSTIDIEHFTRGAGVSRTQLYKKIKAITKQTLFEFIYLIRLTRACEILLHENASVTEVAARVGYSNLSVFTRSFTRLFKVNPSKYAQLNRLA